MKELLPKEKYKEVEEKMVLLTKNITEICSLKKSKVNGEYDLDVMYDLCVDIMNYSTILGDELRNLKLYLSTFEANHANLLLLKERHCSGNLSLDEINKYGWSKSYTGDVDVKTEAKRKFYRDADTDIAESKAIIENIKATIVFVEDRIAYCRFIWTPFDRYRDLEK